MLVPFHSEPADVFIVSETEKSRDRRPLWKNSQYVAEKTDGGEKGMWLRHRTGAA